MTRADRLHMAVAKKLNTIRTLVGEIMEHNEELGMIENTKDFSKAELIDVSGARLVQELDRAAKFCKSQRSNHET